MSDTERHCNQEEQGERREDEVLKRHRWPFRTAAILVGLFPFILCELGLRGIGWEPGGRDLDPYVGFDAIRPLFRLQPGTSRLHVAPERRALFCEATFERRKQADAFRVFCLGGSTVQGRPYATETAFPRWLEISLQTAEPNRRWEVINCGGVSYASYRLLPLLREVLQYEPDLIVLYTGHNEFLERRTYEHVISTPGWARTVHAYASASRLYQSVRGLVLRLHRTKSPQLAVDADPMLDYRGGLAAYRRDDEFREQVCRHFSHSVKAMIQQCERAGVPILICLPVSDLKGTPPFKSAFAATLSIEKRKAVEELAGRSKDGSLTADELAVVRRIVDADPRCAAAQFALGKSLLAAGQATEARKALQRAKDEDLCPLRMLESMQDDLRDIARAAAVPTIDVRFLIEQRSANRIVGPPWLVDHVHPSIEGHQLIADAIRERMIVEGWAAEGSDWQRRQSEAFQRHLEELPPSYFVEAEERRDGLRRWTEGRAFQVH